MSPDSSSSGPIEILLVSDANYAAYLATTILSIVQNGAPEDRFRFHIVDGGLTDDDREKIAATSRELGFETIEYRLDLSRYQRELDCASGTAFPVVVNYRLFAARFLPETLDKVLYLDVDVIALKSVRELWETPLNGAICAAVPDKCVAKKRVLDVGLPDDWRYFNSGVMLIDLKKWRDDALLQTFFEILESKKDALTYPDQDALNLAAARSSYVVLEERWNCLPRDLVEGETCLLHYSGRRHRCPHLDIWSRLAAQTPYKRLPFQSARYKIARVCRRVLYDVLCIFTLFSAKGRRSLRKFLKVR